MPDDTTGRATPSSNRGGTQRNNVPSTLITNNIGLPNSTDLVAKLAATTGPVKNANEAKLFLKQRSLIALENNYGMATLANLLILMLFEAKIPEHIINIIRAVAFLMVGEFHNTFAEDMAVVVVEKLLIASEQVTKQFECECEFLAASATSQAENTQQLTEIVASIKNTSQTLTSMSQKLTTSTDSIVKSTADIQPMIKTLTSSTEPMSSITESAKVLAKAVEELKNNPPHPHSPSSHTRVPNLHMQMSQEPICSAHQPHKHSTQKSQSISLTSRTDCASKSAKSTYPLIMRRQIHPRKEVAWQLMH